MRLLRAAVVSSAIALLAWFLFFAPSGLVCFGETIETSDQAIAFAKQLIVRHNGILVEAQMESREKYIAAIERDPKCCVASYGPHTIEGNSQGWNVAIFAYHLPNEYEHIFEFNRCGSVIYNGGVSSKGSRAGQ